MAGIEDVVNGLNISEVSTEIETAPANVIFDSTDPYESLTGRTVSESRDDAAVAAASSDGGDRQNGDIGLLELAVEAQPDLIFKSDLVSSVNNIEERDPSQQSPFVRPRVYLEKESFSQDDSISHTAASASLVKNIYSMFFKVQIIF